MVVVIYRKNRSKNTAEKIEKMTLKTKVQQQYGIWAFKTKLTKKNKSVLFVLWFSLNQLFLQFRYIFRRSLYVYAICVNVYAICVSCEVWSLQTNDYFFAIYFLLDKIILSRFVVDKYSPVMISTKFWRYITFVFSVLIALCDKSSFQINEQYPRKTIFLLFFFVLSFSSTFSKISLMDLILVDY